MGSRLVRAVARGCEISELDGVYLNLQRRPATYAGQSRGQVWVPHRSIFEQRLSVVNDTIASLNIRIRELERLRDQVKKAQLSARRSRSEVP
jgi:hypothetical protein